MIDHMYLSVSLFCIAIAVGVVLITSEMSRLRKLIVLVLISIGAISTYRSIFYFYGYPTVLNSSFKDTLVLGHLSDKSNGVIYLWLKEPDQPPRSYTIPYSPKMAKQLNKLRGKNRGKPYRADIGIRSSHSNAYRDGVDEIRLRELPTFPKKRR